MSRLNLVSLSVAIYPQVKPEDEGVIACKVWNQHGTIWRNFTIKIEGNTREL